MPEIKIIDTTLRDAHQCLWATRMTTAMMLPVAERMDRAGFECIDLVGGPQFDVCVRYLKENPWERIRLMRQKVRNTKMQWAQRGKSLLSFDVLPDDVNALWLELMARNGIRRVRVNDPLGDSENLLETMHQAKALGMEVVGAIVYCLSPVHTDEFFAAKTKVLIERGGVDVMMIKDPGGLLTPDRIRTLVPAMLAVMGDVPLELHSHCITGLAPLVYLEAVKLGVTLIETSIAPLAQGPAQPATQTMVRNLRDMGYEINLDDEIVDAVSDHFSAIARHENLPVGVPAEYDEFHYKHQIPGGMMENMKFQLKQAGLIDRFDEVLEEASRVFKELGWPVMVTPYSQLVGIQSVLNVVQGERYKTIPDEVKKYACGYYGKIVAPVEPNVLDKIISNGSPNIPLVPQPLEPALPALRKKYPNLEDEERLLRYMYPGSQVDDMIGAGPMCTDYQFEKPIIQLLRELSARPAVARVHIQTAGLRLDASH